MPTTSIQSNVDYESKEQEAVLTPSSNSQTSHCAGMASDDGDGTLLLDGGRSQFVSSLHFALLADEVSIFCFDPSFARPGELHVLLLGETTKQFPIGIALHFT
jgi:hypothetical protein